MTTHIVDIEEVTHTCPGQGLHPYDIRRTLVDVIAGGPCRTPITIRSGNTITQIPCHRHEPPARQCAACRLIVIERTITTRHLDDEAAG